MESAVLQNLLTSFDKKKLCVGIIPIRNVNKLQAVSIEANDLAPAEEYCKVGNCQTCGLKGKVSLVGLEPGIHTTSFKEGLFCKECKSLVKRMIVIERQSVRIQEQFENSVSDVKAVLRLKQSITTPDRPELKVEEDDELVNAEIRIVDDNTLAHFSLEESQEEERNCFKANIDDKPDACRFRNGDGGNTNTKSWSKLPFTCYFCQWETINQAKLYSHIMGQHLLEFPWTSSNHRTSYVKEKPYKVIGDQRINEHICEPCGKSFRFQSELKKHSVMHLPSDSRKRFGCESCHKSFARPSSLKIHRIAEHGAPGQTFPCPFSNCTGRVRIFATKCRLKEHVTRCHRGIDFRCEHCGKLLRSSLGLKKHKEKNKTCARISNRNLELHTCPRENYAKSFTDFYLLKNHIAAIHVLKESKRTEKCELCSESFHAKNLLGRHMFEKHGGVPCDKCKRKFFNFKSFEEHKKRLHNSGEDNKGFRCKVPSCKKAFLYKYELLRHEKYSHERAGRPECYFCQKKFSTATSVQDHMMGKHLGELPFSCGVTGCCFRTSSEVCLKNHLKRQHHEVKNMEEGL